MKDGVLLAIEGVDGAGKRSVSDALVAFATSLGLSAQFFTFPNYQSPTGTAIATYLAGSAPSLTPDAAAMLFACDRLQSRDVLCQALASSDLVVVDRYVDSNAAYQAARMPPAERENFTSWVRSLEHDFMAMPRPTLTVLLEVSPNESRRRRLARQSFDRPDEDHYEASTDLLIAAAEQYRQLATQAGWSTVRSTDRSLDEVIQDAWCIVRKVLQG